MQHQQQLTISEHEDIPTLSSRSLWTPSSRRLSLLPPTDDLIGSPCYQEHAFRFLGQPEDHASRSSFLQLIHWELRRLPEQMMLLLTPPPHPLTRPWGPDPGHVEAKTGLLGCSPGAHCAQTGLFDCTGAQSVCVFFTSLSKHAVVSVYLSVNINYDK